MTKRKKLQNENGNDNPNPSKTMDKEITKAQYEKAQQIVFKYEALNCHKL